MTVVTAPSFFQNSFTRSKRIIYTPSAFARTSLLHLQEAGSLTSLAPHVSDRAGLDSYLFFVVTAGKGSISYDGITRSLTAGDCVFIDCRKGYRQSASAHKDANGQYDELWSLSWVHFDGPTMRSIYDKYLERGGQAVFHQSGALEKNVYEVLTSDIFQIATSDSFVRDMEIAAKLTELLTCLMTDAWDPENSGTPSTRTHLSAIEVQQYIDEHYQKKISREDLSKVFFVSKQHLSRIFKEQTGFTVNAYLTNVRISKAKNLLRFSDKTIDEISFEAGFEDSNYFARCFRKVEGISPSEYRKRW